MASKLSYRFIVLDQLRDDQKYELRLKLRPVSKCEQSANEDVNCLLTGIWFSCDVEVNEIIHVLDTKYDNNTCTMIVDNTNGFVVKNPDLLISSTTLMSAKYCVRKAWLSAKFVGWTHANRSMIIGVMVHQLFQESCQQRLRTVDEIRALFMSIVDNFITDLYAIVMTKDEAIQEVTPYLTSIVQWIDKYMYNMSVVEDMNYSNKNEKKIQIMKVLDIEDSVWSTKLGLKGIVDLTVKVAVNDNNIQTSFTMPLELKTGKPSFSDEHIGQIGLYSVMLDERDKTHSNEGLLLYLKDKPQMRQIITKRVVKRDLFQMRNNLVKHLTNVESGPEPLNSYRICSKCDHLMDCCLTLQTLESHHLSHSTSMSEQLIPQIISHLSALDLEFFKKWMTLLNMELKEVIDRDSDSKVGFWTELSTDREAKGLGFGKLKILRQTNDSIVFVRCDKYLDDCNDFNLTDNVMRRWERVAISIDDINIKVPEMYRINKIALLIGFIKRVDRHEIEVISDKSGNLLSNRLYRIDHISNTGLISHNFTNILRLMDSDDDQSKKLRQIVIHKKSVTFVQKFKKQIITKGKHILKVLNRNQQRAILSALSTDSYILIQGMPGAGKTQTIVALIRLLVALEQSVIITSYTHSAVDNILLKLKEYKIDFLRIGSEKRVNPELLSYTNASKTSSFKTLEQLLSFYSSTQVVATTCYGVSSHPLFKRKVFDYCIVDEASQVLLPACLGPLFYCNRFLLVGDSRQLPPVVQNEKAKQLGLDQSLFVLLQNETNTRDLTIQYRMNSEIMRLSNELTYNGVLMCATLDVCNQTLVSSDLTYLVQNNWITKVIQNDLSNSVIFIETDLISAPEIRDQKGKVFNEIESKIIKIIVKNLLKYFVITTQQIGVISPYQKQVGFLRDTITLDGLEVNTVDQFQGRDKDVIIYSCVKSNTNESVGNNEILNDERRLNVAITRAKKKLVIIGNKSTLNKYKPFHKLFNILRNDQILSLNSSDLL
ncbi:DNA replication ATP-dependent helicase/nuclease DNA2-like [Oppia nitens]|uniref:DNA replication ATP-dependent helicase/nuclease DNA2-like n=1 Tax=Oppia nitens TaxID=1686743 RepID=UPI0023DC3099|nr:DNA replication ATP-dependent helicase/nuclease DNA2-like [Oppia nitens]